jgi:cytidyltransferase-like protein
MNVPDRDLLEQYGRTEPFARAYLGGTFDLFHRGHLALMARARRIAKEIVVGVNTDEFAERYKRKPVMCLADRIAVLSACRLVDHVVLNVGDEDSKPAIVHAGVDCIVHGSDWVGEPLMRQMGLTPEFLRDHGITMVTLPYTPWVSSTSIVEGWQPVIVRQVMREELAH